MATLSKLDKLTYSIGIIDKVTGPVNKVMAKINQLSQQTAAAQDQMMRGATTAVAGGYALAKSLAPAIDHVAALGEVKSLGVADDALKQLTKTSYEFGFQFGGNSAEFVRSAYDIQSAIAGLSGNELSEFTKTSNILAVATKADAATITSYMGTMYGIFEKTANKMGKANWVNQIAGQTATAVQLYKTTGAEMQAAFSNLSNTATSVGLSSAQQFAMVGQLQLVAKSGSVAGTQAEKFIQGIGKAEKVLGLKLTTDNGDMLAVDKVLGKINTQISKMGGVDKLGLLTEIFGAQGAKAVNVLSEKVQGLNTDIKKFENIQNASKAQEMANIIASPWDRLGGSFNAAATAMGNRLLPVVEPFVEMLAAAFAGIVALTEQFPVLSSALATAVVVVVGLVTAFGLVNFAMGLFKFSGLTLTPIIDALKYATGLYATSNKALAASLATSTTATQGASIASTLYTSATNKARIAYELFNTRLLMPTGLVLSRIKALGFIGTMKLIPTVLAAGFASMSKFAVGLFNVTRIMGFLNAVMLANPLGVIIGLVVLLAVLIYKFWQPIKAFMTGFWDGFVHSFAPVIDVFSELGTAFLPIINAVKSVFNWFASLFAPVEQSSQALAGITSAGEVFGLVFGEALNLILLPIKAVIWFTTKLVNGITWIGSAIGDMWSAVQSPLNSFFNIIKTVFGYSPMGMLMSGYGKAFDWLSEKVGGLQGIADSIKDFFNFGDDQTQVKATKVTQAVQPQTMVMQSADQAYSRDYGQRVISKATSPVQQASPQVLRGQAANDPTATVNLQGQARSQALIDNAFAGSRNSAVTNSAVNAVSNSVIPVAKTLISNVTNAANSPVYNPKQTQLVSVNQGAAPAPVTASIKTDQVITNSAITSAYKVDQLSTEQQQSNNYKAKVQKSAFLQTLSSSTSNTNHSNDSDNSKRVHIDSLTIKSDDLAQSFEQMMELAG